MTLCAVEGCEKPKRSKIGYCRTHLARWHRTGTTDAPTRYEFCTVEGCDRKADRPIAGLCEAHYFQQWRNGKITSQTIKLYGTQGCKEPDCDKPHRAYGWCDKHYTRWLRNGDAQVVLKPSHWSGPAHPLWRGDDASYRSIHQRIARARGPASAHVCLHCGKTARHWAYDHTDPNEMTATGYGSYSADPERYIPLCPPCHKRFDLDCIYSRVFLTGVILGMCAARADTADLAETA